MAVQRADIENKLRQIEQIVDDSTEQVKTTATSVVIGVVVIIFVAFILGRRRGKKRGKARVEVFHIR